MKCRRVGSVKAVSICDLYALSNDDFQHVLDEFPNMRVKLEGVASERLAMITSSRDMINNGDNRGQAQPSRVHPPASPLLRQASETALSTSVPLTTGPGLPSSNQSAMAFSTSVISTAALSTQASSTSSSSHATEKPLV